MKKILFIGSLALVLSACDGDIVKNVARAVLSDETNQSQQDNSAQNPQVQSNQTDYALQPVPINPNMPTSQENQYTQPTQIDQYGQPIQTMPEQATQMHDAAVLPKPEPKPSIRERVVRKPAYVLTQHGSNVMVRRSPNKNSAKVGYLYDGEDIWVVGETNNCQTINGLYGCWVKVVDAHGLTGYSFGAYLQY